MLPKFFFIQELEKEIWDKKPHPWYGFVAISIHLSLSGIEFKWTATKKTQTAKYTFYWLCRKKNSTKLHFKSEFCGIKSGLKSTEQTIRNNRHEIAFLFQYYCRQKKLRNITIYRVCVSALMRERIQSPLFIRRQRKKDERSKEYERRKNTKRTKKKIKMLRSSLCRRRGRFCFSCNAS